MRFRRFFSAFFCAVLLLTLCPLAGAAEEKALPTLDIKAKAALLVDQNTGKIVYGKNEHEELYPASLTKIMTCLIALENGNLSDVVTVSESALADLDEDSSVAGLVVGEQMTLENLLYCMMVVSSSQIS